VALASLTKKNDGATRQQDRQRFNNWILLGVDWRSCTNKYKITSGRLYRPKHAHRCTITLFLPCDECKVRYCDHMLSVCNIGGLWSHRL